MMSIRLSGFAKLLISSAVISLLIFAIAFLLSLIHLGDDVVEAKVSASGVNFSLQEYWNPQKIAVGAVGFSGAYNLNGKALDENYFDKSTIESISFENPLPPHSSVRFLWQDNRLLLSIGLVEIEKQKNNSASGLPIDKADILISASPIDGDGTLQKTYLKFGRDMEIILDPSFFLDKKIRFEFPPAIVSGIDFHPDEETSSGQYPLVKEIAKEQTMIASGDFFFSGFQDKVYTLRKSEPITFSVNVGVIESVDITPDMLDIYFIANTSSVKRTEYRFSGQVGDFSYSSFSPTALDLAIKNRVFQLLIPIISFVVALVGLFELFEVTNVFRRTFGVSDSKPVQENTIEKEEPQQAIGQAVDEDFSKNNENKSVENES